MLIFGREDVTLVSSESVASPLAEPATARCPSGQWTSYDALVLSARATVACSIWTVDVPERAARALDSLKALRAGRQLPDGEVHCAQRAVLDLA